MFKSTFFKNTIIVAIVFAFQSPIFAQAINADIEVKTENLPVVLIEEETDIVERQASPASSSSAQLYFTINPISNIIKSNYNNDSSLFVVHIFGQPRIKVNDFVDTNIIVNSRKQSMNLVYAVIHYPSDKLMFRTIDFDHSAFSLFLKRVDAEKGTVTILAIQPFPGIQGIANVAHLQFKALAKGDVNLNWGDDSVVLANDGFDTNILGDVINTYYRIE